MSPSRFQYGKFGGNAMGGNPVIDGGNLGGRQPQSKLGAPPHDVFGRQGPLRRHQVPDFALRQGRAELLAEIANGFRTAEPLAGASAIGMRQPVGMRGL